MTLRRPLRGLGGERGLTLVELLVVTVVFGIVIGAVTTLFVQATSSEADLNSRFRAQLSARLALDRLRREIHCATAVTPTGPSSTIALTLPSTCRVGAGTSATWCAVPFNGSTTRFRLWRSVSAPCGDAGDGLYADFLTTGAVFNYVVQSSASLATVNVDLIVDPVPAKPGRYRLRDALVLRNSRRLCVAGSPSPPC